MTESRIPSVIRPMIRDFAGLLQNCLHGHVDGLYLQGSAALGGFRPGRSDIDFIAILNQPPTDEDLSAIDFIHKELSGKHPYYKVTEGQYTTLAHLNKSVLGRGRTAKRRSCGCTAAPSFAVICYRYPG